MSHLGHRLSALIDGELDDEERDRVLVHLVRCQPCRAEAVALRTLKRRMRTLGEAAADVTLTRRLIELASLGGLAGEPAASPSGPARSRARELRPSWYVTAGAAAAVVAGVGAAAFFAGGGGQQPEPRVTPAVDSYVLQHDLMTGVVPARPARSARSGQRPGKTFTPHVP